MKKQAQYFMRILLGCAVTLLLQGCGSQSYFQSVESGEESLEREEAATDAEPEETSEHTSEIVVQVAGCVEQPGVYTLAADARVYEAITCAGGLRADAYDRDLNQASKLEDGQMIYVPSEAEHEKASAESQESSDGRLNLNTATEAELMTLPGIGASKANLIVSYREEHGKFSKPDDIMQIQGIKSGVFNQIKDLVVVN